MANTHTESRPVKEQLMEALADFQSGRTQVVGNCVKKSKAPTLAEATATTNSTTKFPEERKHKLLIFKDKNKKLLFSQESQLLRYSPHFWHQPTKNEAGWKKRGGHQPTKNE